MCTSEHSNKFLNEIGIADNIQRVMIANRLGQRFNKQEMIILVGSLDREELAKERFEVVKKLGNG
ncbi:MAG: hypothetical protein JKY30_11020 [Flavobacteriales bacterium]|nr:hypothetical protein [Flavobacteriales bacterium]